MKNETELECPESAETGAAELEVKNTAGEDATVEMSWSPGALVKHAREARKLSLEALSLQTKLSVRVLRALEIDDFDALSEPVFVRGYYRSCAQALGIPAGEVTNAYERASGEPPPRPLPLKPTVAEDDLHPPPRWLPYLVLAIVAAGLVALVMWWGQPVTQKLLDTPGTARQTAPLAAEHVGSTGPAAFHEVAPPAAPAVQPVASSAREDSVAVVADTAAPAVPAATNPAEPAAATPAASDTGNAAPAVAGSGTLTIEFTKKSWVRITDATGTRLLNGLIPAGSRRELSGKPPFDVLLGYAPGVNLSYDGKAVSLSDHIQSNNTAHLTIGEP